jgi:hypothetical protein
MRSSSDGGEPTATLAAHVVGSKPRKRDRERHSGAGHRLRSKKAQKRTGRKGSGRNRNRLGAHGCRRISATLSCSAGLSSAVSKVASDNLCVSSTPDRPRHTRSFHAAHTAQERFWPGWEKEAVPLQLAEWPAHPRTTPDVPAEYASCAEPSTSH